MRTRTSAKCFSHQSTGQAEEKSDGCHRHGSLRLITDGTINRMEGYMSKNILTQVFKSDYPALPPAEPDWRGKYPPGSVIQMAEYETERGWYWKKYRVLKYYPFVVLCEDKKGFKRCFGNWEFRRRQTGQIDGISGRPVPMDLKQETGGV